MKNKKPKKITKKMIRKLEKRNVKKQFKLWSDKVKKRDGYKCVVCGADKFIHTHHLLPREIKEFRFDIDNGITLCAKHHKYDINISAHRNSLNFIDFLLKNNCEQIENLLKKSVNIK